MASYHGHFRRVGTSSYIRVVIADDGYFEQKSWQSAASDRLVVQRSFTVKKETTKRLLLDTRSTRQCTNFFAVFTVYSRRKTGRTGSSVDIRRLRRRFCVQGESSRSNNNNNNDNNRWPAVGLFGQVLSAVSGLSTTRLSAVRVAAALNLRRSLHDPTISTHRPRLGRTGSSHPLGPTHPTQLPHTTSLSVPT